MSDSDLEGRGFPGEEGYEPTVAEAIAMLNRAGIETEVVDGREIKRTEVVGRDGIIIPLDSDFNLQSLGMMDTVDLADVLPTFGPVLTNKDALIGEPFFIVKWLFSQGDMGLFVSAHVITQSGEKFIVNDGSTGMCQQLQDITTKHNRNAGLVVKGGLRKSTYPVKDDSGKPTGKVGETYYLVPLPPKK